MKINYVIGAFLCVLGCYGCSSPKTEVKSAGRSYQNGFNSR